MGYANGDPQVEAMNEEGAFDEAVKGVAGVVHVVCLRSPSHSSFGRMFHADFLTC